MKKTKYFLLFFISILIFNIITAQNKSNKRGIGYGYHSVDDMQTISQGISWWYNWSTLPDNEIADIYNNYNMEFVPMLWNNNSDTASLRDFLKDHPDVKYILAFNEPNFISQANMTPSDAANNWPRIEEIADEFGLEIVGPAVNYCGSCVSENSITFYDPFEYLDSFFVKCADCRIDYITIHNYMCYRSALEWYIGEFYKYGKKIWLTEFSCWESPQPSNAKFQQDYLIEAMDLLEHETMVYRYAWFYGRTTGDINGYPYHSVYNSDPGTLTKLGDIYVNYNPIHDTNIFTKVPARIEAEHYNAMSGIDVESTDDADGMIHVKDISINDWLQYNIEVTNSNDYKIYLRRRGVVEGQIELYSDNILAGVFESTTEENDTKIWYTDSLEINIDSGLHTLKLLMSQSGYRLNWIYISDTSMKFEDYDTDPDSPEKLVQAIANNKIKIYPNPVTNGIFIIELTKADYNSDIYVEVIDISGRQIFSKKVISYNNFIKINLNERNKNVEGIYFIKIYYGNEIWFSKIIYK